MLHNEPQLMIDIETLATTPESVVYEVGIIKFTMSLMDLNGRKSVVSHKVKGRCWQLHTKDQRDRETDPGTLIWMKNTPGRMEALESAHKQGISIREWASAIQGEGWFDGSPWVWCKGPHFDISILESLFKQATGKRWVPWKYSKIRDLRTMDAVCMELGIPVHCEEVTHDALADCRLQVRQLEGMLDELQHRIGYKNDADA
jgi:hypothetical protein